MFDAPSRRRNPLPLVIAVVIGLVVIVVTYLVLRPGKSGSGADNSTSADCTQLVVSSSSEKAALLGELADRYNKAGRHYAGGKCAGVKVHSKASGAAMDALAAGWDPARDGAPAPDVWTPAASSWVGLLKQKTAAGDKGNLIPDGKIPSIAQSPLVIAMPRPMAEAMGWPGKQIGWSDIDALATNAAGWGAVGHPEWGAFKLGKTNPHFSTSGLNATIAAYYAATGRSSDLTEADIADPKVDNFVKGVESAVVHYGDISLTFLSNLADADARGQGMAYISAVTVEEKSVFDYNQGNPTGDPALMGKGTKPRVPLVAVYPKEGTLVSDHPYAVLATASDDKKAAAADFLAFVQAPDQQKRFTELAFRDHDGKAGSVLEQGTGAPSGAKLSIIDPPTPAVLAKIATSWDQLRKKARVLLVLDVSGSMAELTAGGKSKLELAKQAALQTIGMFGPDDQVGLWSFSTETSSSGGKPYTELVPPTRVGDSADRIKSVISGLHAEGGTALYFTTRAAQRKMLADADPSRINAVVVLTDGKNEYPPDNDLDALLKDLDASSLERSVRVFTIAYGDKADYDVLTRISKASRAAAYDARDPSSIDKVLVQVVSNF